MSHNLSHRMIVEFLRSNGEPVRLIDLGTAFLDMHNIPTERYSDAFKIGIDPKISKAGNVYYEYSQNGVSLPDGLNTFIRVSGAVIPFGKVHPSKKGYPTREGQTQILVFDTIYKVTVFLTEAKTPYYIKVVMHKKPDISGNLKKAQLKPRGGSIL